MAEKSLYDVLEIPKTATADELKQSFRRLAMKYHPDRHPGDRQAEENFKKINAAYEVLQDPKKRALYDEFGQVAVDAGFDETVLGAYRRPHGGRSSRHAGVQGDPFSGFGGAGGFGGAAGFQNFDVSSIFGDLFGGGGSRQPRRPHGVDGDDLEMTLSIPFALSIRGGEHQFSFSKSGPCDRCGGTGTQSGSRGVCKACKGTGQGADTTQSLTARIPVGAYDGMKLRFAGQGAAGVRGGKAGDLYVTLKVAPHPRVRREGNDLFLDLPVTPLESFVGGEVKVPTFDGSYTVRIPPHSQSGRKLRLKGLGAPGAKGQPRGDFYAVLQVVLPDVDTMEVRDACATLSEAFPGDVRSGIQL